MSISIIYNYITIVHKSLLQHSYTEHIIKLACSNIVYKKIYQSPPGFLQNHGLEGVSFSDVPPAPEI